jgi:hypothetical protein
VHALAYGDVLGILGGLMETEQAYLCGWAKYVVVRKHDIYHVRRLTWFAQRSLGVCSDLDAAVAAIKVDAGSSTIKHL